MKTLVTGATGFIGSYVVEELLRNGHKVIALSRDATTAKNRPWFNEVTFIPFDIHSQKELLLQNIGNPEALIHLAWHGLPNYNSLHHFEKNLAADYFFLKSLVTQGLKNVLVAGTCFEYGMKNGCLTSDLATEPTNSYALAKDTLRKFLQQLQRQVYFNLKWVRLFYLYGRGQSETSILSQLETALKQGEDEFKMSGGEQLRDYLHVEEAAKEIISIALDESLDGVMNCCSGSPISIRNFVEEYLKRTNRSMKLNLGYFPYSEYEPMAFWGYNKNKK